MQRVSYPGFPKVDGSKYLSTSVEIYQEILREEHTDKSLKRWMRTQGWFDKETYESLLEFLGVQLKGKGKPVALTSKAKALLDEKNNLVRVVSPQLYPPQPTWV